MNMPQDDKRLSHSLMSSFKNIATSIFSRLNFGLTFWASLWGLAALIFLVWILEMFDDLYSKVVLTSLYAVIPVVNLTSSQKDENDFRAYRWMNCIVSGFLTFGCVLLYAEKHELHALGSNVVLVASSVPFLMFWLLIRKKPLLGLVIVPCTIFIIGYLAFMLFLSGSGLQYLFLPLPVVSVISALWTIWTWILLRYTEKCRYKRTWGPLTESALMLFLFAPVIVIVILVSQAISEGDTWPTVVGVLLSVVFGSVVSVPIRRFLLDLGDLSRDSKS